MKYNDLEKLYKKAGCTDLQFRTLEQIKEVLGIDVAAIKGVDSLGIAKGMFFNFMINFLNSKSIEERNKVKPISVGLVREKNKFAYIRFDLMKGKDKCWLHVKRSNEWY